MLQLNLDGTVLDVRADLKKFTAMRGKGQEGVQSSFTVDPHARLAWRELDKLDLDTLQYYGTDPGIEDYLAERRNITKLVLMTYERPRLDLRKSHIHSLSLDIAEGGVEVLLPKSVNRLTLIDPRADAPARFVLNGTLTHGVSILYWKQNKALPQLFGLEKTPALSIQGASEVSADWILRYPRIEQLSLNVCTRVVGVAELAGLSELRALRLYDCFTLDLGEDFGTPRGFENLREVTINGTRKNLVETFKRRFAGTELELTNARTDAWLRTNADNPFAEWLEHYPRPIATRARTIYKQACVALGKRGVTPAVARPILETFVAELNRLAKRRPFDTTMREDVDEAYETLLTLAPGIDLAEARQWLTSEEDF
jgi:hypothetical protein